MADEFCLKMPDFHVTFRDLLHAVNVRHGTDGFTSPPKEGALRIFSPRKIQQLRLGLNPRTWVGQHATSRPPKPLHTPVTSPHISFYSPSNSSAYFICLSWLLQWRAVDAQLNNKGVSSVVDWREANCALLGYYAVSSCNLLPKFRHNLKVPSSYLFLDSRTLKMGPVGCLETSHEIATSSCVITQNSSVVNHFAT